MVRFFKFPLCLFIAATLGFLAHCALCDKCSPRNEECDTDEDGIVARLPVSHPVPPLAGAARSKIRRNSKKNETTRDKKNEENEARFVLPARHTKHAPEKRKQILFWTHFFGMRDYEFGLGHQPFVDNDCPVNNCETLIDTTKVESADAVIFHMRNVNADTRYPTNRLPNQRYVFFLLEHPYNQWNDVHRFNGFFNWTMTYRLDSDIPILYGKTLPRSAHDQGTNDVRFSADQIKTRSSVAWLVSNCVTKIQREVYANELKKHISVDVYGACGDLKCPDNGQNPHTNRMDESCYRKLEKEYNFYLSMESAYCHDYVTEKVFNILKLNVVPIVYGGTNYTRDTPPHSVINIEDYPNPKDLALYLKHLMQNPDKYLEYLQWKDRYKVISKEAYRQGFCKLCELLNDPNSPPKSHQDIGTWWGKETVCDNNRMAKIKERGKW